MKIVKGNIINPIDIGNIEFFKKGNLLINNKGIIEKINIDEKKYSNIEIFDFGNNFIIPGFIDIHTHLPQYPMIGIGRGELLDWLENYIFPAEEKFEDLNYAVQILEKFINSLHKFGTTTALVFSSSHIEPLKKLSLDFDKRNIRFFIGNSLMDSGKGNLIKSTDFNLNSMNDLFELTKNIEDFNYIITPRYAGNCSETLMQKASEFAKENELFIQTHLSENKNEIKFINNKFNSYKNYTDIYNKNGLISDKTILAHCIYLSNQELEILNENKSIIAHCPTSNIYLKSGIMPLKKYLNLGLRIGLGTDVAGGYSLDMKTELRNAKESSKIFSLIKNKDEEVDLNTIFPLSNIKAAEYLKIDSITGNLKKGKFADFTVIENSLINKNISIDNALGQIFYNEQKDSIATFFKGNLVYKNQNISE